MTCGHNSNSANKCPFKCPKSKSLIDLDEREQAEVISKVDEIIGLIDNLEETEKLTLLGKLFTEVDDDDMELEVEGESE